RPFGVTQSFGGFLVELVGRLAHHFQQIARAGRQMELPRPAIGGVGAALDESRLREPVDHSRKGDWLDLDQFSERTLPDALLPLQIAYQPPLQRGHAATFRARVERPAEQPRGIVHQKADRLIHGRTYNSNCYIINWGSQE